MCFSQNVLAAVIFLAATAGRADDLPVYSHFGFCTPPVPPACVETLGENVPISGMPQGFRSLRRQCFQV